MTDHDLDARSLLAAAMGEYHDTGPMYEDADDYLATPSGALLLARIGEAEALRAALDETTRMLAYLWGAENYNGHIVHDMFYGDDPLNEDVPKVIEMARAVLAAPDAGPQG